MVDKVTLRACPYCGSMDTHPALLFGGPIPWVDHNDGGYVCRTCGRTAVPLDFDTFDELKNYQREVARKDDVPIKTDFLSIPLFPVDTGALFNIPIIDLPIGQVAEVVGIEYSDGELRRSGPNAVFYNYYKAVGGPIYSSKEIAMLDLSGINQGRPNFDVLKDLIKRKYEVWLDIGMRDIQDLFDSFAMDVSRAIIGTKNAPEISMFQEAFELSDRCIPCVEVSGDKVLRPNRKAGPTKFEDAVNELKDIGFETIGVLDLDHLGRKKGISDELLARAIGTEAHIIYGGGVVETDLESIRRSGAVGAFLDPFTPMIMNLLDAVDNTVPEKTPASHDMPTSERSPTARPQWSVE